jgi:hypothetical protein
MFPRSALIGLLAAAAAAASPAAASASIAPGMSLDQSAGTTAGSIVPTGFAINFNPKLGDSVRDLTLSFPAGFLVNLQTNGGVCLASSTPNPLCQIGAGTVNGPTGSAVRLYLVAPPAFGDLAGVDLVVEGGGTSTGGITLTGSPSVALNLAFTSLPGGIGELQFSLTGRLPSSCSTTPLVKLAATSYFGSSGAASAPMSVTGCGSMTYAPAISSTVAKQPKGSGTVVTIAFSQGAGDSATSSLQFGTPTGVKINKVLAPCFAGTTCTVGSIAIQSPLLPSTALAGGALTLAGAINAASRSAPITGALTMAFPPPYQYFVEGPINLAEHTITFLGLPDIPITAMTLTFTGTTAGPAFVTNCEAGTITATATPQDGAPAVKLRGASTTTGCPPPGSRPVASGSIGGLASGKPRLHLSASRHGSGTPLTSLSVGLPGGLSFKSRALKGSCRRGGHGCGLSVSGAAVKSVGVSGGKLVLSLGSGASHVSLTVGSPLLSESNALQAKARRHRAGRLRASVTLHDESGLATAVRVP